MKNVNLKVGMFLQMRGLPQEAFNAPQSKVINAIDDLRKRAEVEFDKTMKLVKTSDLDLLVFPESCKVPDRYFDEIPEEDFEDLASVYEQIALKISREIGKAVIVGFEDCLDEGECMITNAYANAHALDNETGLTHYDKHTMVERSPFDFEDYMDYGVCGYFPVIKLKGYKIGMTICYDCNHAPFSRIYGMQGVDLLINSSGQDLDFYKWYKYNKVRAIENDCFNLVVDGYIVDQKKQGAYALGYNPEGKELPCVGLKSGMQYLRQNNIYDLGEVYVFDLSKDKGGASVDTTLDQEETLCKYENLFVPVGNSAVLLKNAQKLKENLYVMPHQYIQDKKINNCHVVFCVVEGDDIFLPEKVLSLLYAKELSSVKDKRYVIVNRYGEVDKSFYQTKLSVLLKVRAMENYCAVLLESKNLNKCIQTTMNRGTQMVKPFQGKFGIVLNRTTGPEAIWKNKKGMSASWRKGFEWLVDQLNF